MQGTAGYGLASGEIMSRPFVLEKRKPRSQIRLEIERIRAEKELAKYREERLTKFDLAAIKERLRR